MTFQADGYLTGSLESLTFSTTVPSSMIVINPGKNYRLGVKKLHHDAVLPTKAHSTDLGMDLYALEDTILKAGVVTKVSTGIACEFPYGYGALLRDRSSMATKKEVFVVAGVIDQDYTGEVCVALFNPGTPAMSFPLSAYGPSVYQDGDVEIKKGDKIAQMILIPTITFPIVEVDELHTTARGANGFGSSGR